MESELLTMNEVCDEPSLMFRIQVLSPWPVSSSSLKRWRRISCWVKDLGIWKTTFSFKG